MCNNPKSASGFTLLELIVAISIASILTVLAIPSFSDMMRNNRLTTYANELVTSLNLARSEAVKRSVVVSVRKVGGAGAYWSASGWTVFVDDGGCSNSTNLAVPPPCVTTNSGNGVIDANELILRTYPALSTAYTLVGNNNIVDYISYEANGTSNTGGSFAICDNSDGNNLPEPYTSRLIIINTMGRIRMGKDSNNDGIPEKDNNTTPTPLTSCTSP